MPIGFTDPEKKADKNMQTDTSETAKKSEEEVSDLTKITTGDNKKLYMAIAGGVLITIVIVVLLATSGNKKESKQDNPAVSSQVVTTTETPTSSEDISTEVASVEVSDASGYLKDLEGESLTSTYDVVDKEYYKDFVNYELKRASVDDGMEMYWLEITYENKNYRCQIPYYAAATMDISGICVVEIEKLKLASGGSVISYMQVIYDYDKILQE